LPKEPATNTPIPDSELSTESAEQGTD
jgi:hypothetical protein